MLNNYECLCFIISLSLSFQSVSAFGSPAFIGLNYVTNSKSVTGGGISYSRPLMLCAKMGQSQYSIYALQHIGQLFQQILLAESMGDTDERFPMNMEALCKYGSAL